MPPKKPKDLIVRHETKEEQRRRENQVTELTPRKTLTIKAPMELSGEVAQHVWQDTVRLYLTLDARIVSALDKGLLIDFCNVSDQLAQIDRLRATAMSNYTIAQAFLERAQDGRKDDAKIIMALENSVNDTLDLILKLDARADRKRDLLHKFRQSLMLTPRSRGGVSPDEKEKEKPQSEMSKIIDGVAKPVKGQGRKKNV